jgi:hypothetical protein
MRRTCYLLVMLFLSWTSSFGQSAPKLTSPRIVATFQRLGQTGPIDPVTIYTPRQWGTFQISIIIVETVAGGDGYWNPKCFWKDGGGPEESNIILLGTTQRGSGSLVFAARVKAKTPLTFSTTVVNSPGGKYNVWVVVEQLM